MTANTPPITSERCEICRTTAGGARSRCGVEAALIWVLPSYLRASYLRSSNFAQAQSPAESHLIPARRETPAAAKGHLVPPERRPWLRSDSTAGRGYRPRCSNDRAEKSV